MSVKGRGMSVEHFLLSEGGTIRSGSPLIALVSSSQYSLLKSKNNER